MKALYRVLALVVLSLMIAARPVLATDGQPPGQVVFGSDFTLRSGESLAGDLVVFGGNVTIEQNSRVEGNVIAWGGDVEIAGEVEEDVVAFGGNVYLAETARVNGDLMVFGGESQLEEGAVVRGQQVLNTTGWAWSQWHIWPWRGFPVGRPGEFLTALFWQGLRVTLETLLMAALAGILVVLWPQGAARVGRSAVKVPLASFGMGLLTLLAATVIGIVLILTLCLSPIGVAVLLALVVAVFFGRLSLGILLGERVVAALTARTVAPFWVAALGGGLITLLLRLLDLVPCLGWALGLLVTCVGLGAVVLTRFGTADVA